MLLEERDPEAQDTPGSSLVSKASLLKKPLPSTREPAESSLAAPTITSPQHGRRPVPMQTGRTEAILDGIHSALPCRVPQPIAH